MSPAARAAPSSQHASRSCVVGDPTTDTGAWAAAQRSPVVILSIARRAPAVSSLPWT